MIGGTIVYKGKYIYNIKASDTSSVFSFVIQSNNERAIMEMCDPAFQSDEYPDILWERAGEINLSKVIVQTGKYANEKGKLVNIPCNKELFCRLGALISYVKTQCRVTNEVGYTGLSLASGEFEAKSVREYVIAEPLTDEVFAEVSMSFGAIVRLSLKATDFEIELDTVGSEQLFTKPKGAWSSGFRFTRDYLGFDIAPPTPASISSLGGLYETLEDVIAAHPDKDFYWLRGKAYSIVKDENLEEICAYIKSKKRVYFDTETTGLNITFLSRSGQGDQCVGLILSVKFGESFFFPLQMKRVQNLCGGDHFYVMEHYIREILEGCDIVAHNASFDWKTAYIYDINTNIVDDTMAMIRLTYGAEKKNYPIDLKNSSKLILGRDSLELSDLVVSNDWGEGDIRFWDLTEELTKYYACADTDNTMGIDLYFKNNDILAKYNAQKVYEIEVAFSLAVGYQEFYGHHIDVHNLETMREAIGKTMEKLMAQMEEIVGHKFNPNSSVQLKQVMYQELGIPEQIDRATGKVTTNKEALKRLSEIENIDGDGYRYPFCRLLSEYRENEGVRKIVDKFPEIMSPDGYIFPSVYQYGTETGRVSIHDPNYQSYNNPVKKHVIPRPGYYMTDTDYSSIEYRVLASMVRNQRIMKSFEDPDFDYHRYQAAHINRVPYAAVTKKMRKEAKGINFGLPYGMGDESLGARVFGEATPENTRRAASLRSAYFKGQEDIRDWFEFHRDRGVNEGFTETYFGRRRYYRKTDFTEKAIRRQAGNQVIQGTAADCYKLAVGRVFQRICREGWLGKVLLTGFIHDELLAEVSIDIDPMVWLKSLREEFEISVNNEDGSSWCPLYMGFGWGRSWYEAKSVEVPIRMQWELVEKYGSTGLEHWDGDYVSFCDKVPGMIHDFEVRDTIRQLLDPESQGQEIKPALNSMVLDLVSDAAKHYPGDEFHTLYDSDGNELAKFVADKTTQGAITQFCALYGVDRSKVNLLDIKEEASSSGSTTSTLDMDIELDEEDPEQVYRDRMNTQCMTFGFAVDTKGGKFVIKYTQNPTILNFIKKYCHDTGDFKLVFRNFDTRQDFPTRYCINSSDVNVLAMGISKVSAML